MRKSHKKVWKKFEKWVYDINDEEEEEKNKIDNNKKESKDSI